MMRRCKRGFTVIELLLAITLFSVVAVSIYFNFQTSMLLYSRFGKDISSVNGYRLCFDTIEKELHNIVAYDDIAFEGERTRIVFPAFIETYKKGKRRNVFLKISYEYANRKLYRVVKELKREGLSFDKNERKDVILSEIFNGRFEFAYATPDGGISWRDDWVSESDTAIPYGMRFTFIPAYDERSSEDELRSDAMSKTFMLPLGTLIEVILNE